VNLGNLGEIVKVKDGYARNFLIPSGRARRATEAAKAEFEAKRAELEKAAAEKLAAAQAQGEKLAGTTVKLTQKAGVDGRLFGSVTNHDIAEELNKQGFKWSSRRSACPTAPQDRRRQHHQRGSAHRRGGRSERVGLRRNRLSTEATASPRSSRLRAAFFFPGLLT
jgi:large subunit ribosomal protein L9